MLLLLVTGGIAYAMTAASGIDSDGFHSITVYVDSWSRCFCESSEQWVWQKYSDQMKKGFKVTTDIELSVETIWAV